MLRVKVAKLDLLRWTVKFARKIEIFVPEIDQIHSFNRAKLITHISFTSNIRGAGINRAAEASAASTLNQEGNASAPYNFKRGGAMLTSAPSNFEWLQWRRAKNKGGA